MNMRANAGIIFVLLFSFLALSCVSTGGGEGPLFPRPGEEYRIMNLGLEAQLAAPKTREDAMPTVVDGGLPFEAALWRFKDLGDGAWEIVHAASDKALDVEGGVSDRPAPVNAFPRNGTKAQRWFLRREGPALVIEAAVSGMVLTANEMPGEPFAPVIQAPWEGRKLQLWRLVPAREEGGVGAPVAAKAGKGLLNGQVLDRESGRGLEGLEVRLYEPPTPGPVWSARTGPDGWFGLEEFRDGAFDLAVEPSEGHEGSMPMPLVVAGGKIKIEMPLRIGLERRMGMGAEKDPHMEREADGGGRLRELEGKTLAVAPVSSLNPGVTAETLTAVQEFLIHAFVTGSKCRVLDRGSVDKILEEHEFQVSDLADTRKVVEIGKLAGAEAIVAGSLNMVGSKYYLTVKLVSVATAEILASSIGEGADESAFLEMCLAAVKAM